MKRTLLTLCCAFAALTTYSQSAKIGVKAGINIAQLSASAGGESGATGNTTGFHAGIIADLPLYKDKFTFQTGLLFSQKGGAQSTYYFDIENSNTSLTKATIKLNYLELPLNILFKIPVKTGKVFIGAGPYLAMGLSANAKATTTVNGATTIQKENIKFGDGNDDANRFDRGINLLAGIELPKGITVGAGYSFGRRNILKEAQNASLKNKGFNFSVGYFFK